MKEWKVYKFIKIKNCFSLDKEMIFKEDDIKVVLTGAFKLFNDELYEYFVKEISEEYREAIEEIKHMKITHIIRKKIDKYVIVMVRTK